MSALRHGILCGTGGYSTIAVLRLTGILPCKSGIALYIGILDAAVVATFVVALLWPWLVCATTKKKEDDNGKKQ